MITLDRTDGGGLCGYLTDLDCLVVIVGKLAPGIIINAVVYADVNKAESEEALAALINDQAPGYWFARLRRRGTGLVHYSFDYVLHSSGEQR